MAIINEKKDHVLEVKSKYTYSIYRNGNGGMSIEVQLTESFIKTSLRNFALASISVEDFERRMDVEKINKLFLMLRKQITEYGSYFEMSPDYYGFVKT